MQATNVYEQLAAMRVGNAQLLGTVSFDGRSAATVQTPLPLVDYLHVHCRYGAFYEDDLVGHRRWEARHAGELLGHFREAVKQLAEEAVAGGGKAPEFRVTQRIEREFDENTAARAVLTVTTRHFLYVTRVA